MTKNLNIESEATKESLLDIHKASLETIRKALRKNSDALSQFNSAYAEVTSILDAAANPQAITQYTSILLEPHRRSIEEAMSSGGINAAGNKSHRLVEQYKAIKGVKYKKADLVFKDDIKSSRNGHSR